MLKLMLFVVVFLGPQTPWQKTESENFVIHHWQNERYGQNVAKLAEMHRKRIIEEISLKSVWRHKCDIYCHQDTAIVIGLSEYDRNSDQQIIRRAIWLDVRYEGVWRDILPHEVAHCCFAGEFNRHLPRWLDEGVAMRYESESKRKLHRYHGKDPDVRWLVQVHDYPATTKQKEDFYAQSYVAVDFLITAKGPAVFHAFCRDVCNSGDADRQLLKHYGIQGYAEFNRLLAAGKGSSP